MCVSFAVELLQLEAARRVLCTETILQCGLCHPVPSCRLLHSTEPHAMKPNWPGKARGPLPRHVGGWTGAFVIGCAGEVDGSKTGLGARSIPRHLQAQDGGDATVGQSAGTLARTCGLTLCLVDGQAGGSRCRKQQSEVPSSAQGKTTEAPVSIRG